MTEITLKFDEKNPIAQKTIAYMLSLGVFKKVSGLEKAIDDVEKGKMTKYKDSKDLFKKVLG